MIDCQFPSVDKMANTIIRTIQMIEPTTLMHLSEGECKVRAFSQNSTLLGSLMQFGDRDILTHRNAELFMQRTSMLDRLLNPMGLLGHISPVITKPKERKVK
jgi:hypothetical protein